MSTTRTTHAPMPTTLAPSHPDYRRERYTLGHAAEYLTVSAKFLYSLVAAKRITCARLSTAKNAKIFFSQAALDGYLDTRPHQVMTTAQKPRLVSNGPRRWDLG